MSLGPLGAVASSAAGSPLSQAKGSEVERGEQQSAAQARRVQADQQAESAAGIGEADGEDHETAERDADGRRLWEQPQQQGQAAQPEDAQTDRPPAEQPRSRGSSGQSGDLLDLTG